MKPYGVVIVLASFTFFNTSNAQCGVGRSVTFTRWSGVAPEIATPVFVYSASGDEDSLAGACLARCRELPDCAAVVVAYSRGNCQGIADYTTAKLKVDNDVAFFKKVCLALPEDCGVRWWALENTPGYHLHSEGSHLKVILNITVYECYDAVFTYSGEQKFRSAQWVVPQGEFDPEVMYTSDSMIGNCILNAENRFTEPESYRVSNYYTVYIENQCSHDYPEKIDRCSYEEYYNQTLRHVEFTIKNYTKGECKTSCEKAERFNCRGFTWISEGQVKGGGGRGLCDLHSEDLITTGSWLLRRISSATYYRRVVCLNISVECEGSDMIVTYVPRGVFRGRVYVPGRGERCSARASGRTVRLALPMHGDCDVNFAYGISNGPNGVINRTMAYVMVMIQNNPIIQTAGDRWVRVGCSPDARARHVDTTVAVRDIGSGFKKPTFIETESRSPVAPAAASAVYGGSSAPVTMYVVRARDDTGAGAVSLGEPLELRIETTDATEIKAYHLVASSRLGDSSVLLLDSRGCPTGQVDFPAFSRAWLGGTQRLSARFKAFRFPTSHVVRFALMVRFCDNKCPPVECNPKQGRSARQTNATLYEWGDEVPAAVRADSVPAAVRADSVPAAVRADSVPAAVRADSVPAAVRADSVPAAVRADSVPAAVRADSVPAAVRADSVPAAVRADSVPAAVRADSVPAAVRADSVPAAVRADSVPAAVRADSVPAAVRADSVPAAVRADSVPAAVRADSGVVARGGAAPCAPTSDDALALELDLLVDSKDILSVDTLVRADHRSTLPEDSKLSDGSMVCVHELLLVSLALAWLAVQVLLLLGCCVLVKRYRNLAELNMQKDYQSFDNVGFDTVSTHRRVHWPDQNIDILHAT